MFAIEWKMGPWHDPPSTWCLVKWRDRTLVGMVQHPVCAEFPAIVFLSVTSKYFDPEFVRAVRNLDSGRLQLDADPSLDVTGTFHVLHRDGHQLLFMSHEETTWMMNHPMPIIQVQPRNNGEDIELIPGNTITVLNRPPEKN